MAAGDDVCASRGETSGADWFIFSNWPSAKIIKVPSRSMRLWHSTSKKFHFVTHAPLARWWFSRLNCHFLRRLILWSDFIFKQTLRSQGEPFHSDVCKHTIGSNDTNCSICSCRNTCIKTVTHLRLSDLLRANAPHFQRNHTAFFINILSANSYRSADFLPSHFWLVFQTN
jgi:hypothetical protein